MKVLVTGVAGQLGHDVMNELAKRGYEGIGSDIAPEYSGAADGSAVTTMPYMSMDITDAAAVEKTITESGADVVVHCAAWTAVDLAEDEDKVDKVRAINAGGTQNIADVCKKLYSMVRERLLGLRTVKTMRLLMFMVRLSSKESLLLQTHWRSILQ